MNKYIVVEDDSLITAKRKIRILKNLLKQELFEGLIKDEIR